MNVECAECEHDLRGGHGEGCSLAPMTEPYTPSMAEVRDGYAEHRYIFTDDGSVRTALDEFDRWRAKFEAEVRADQREQDAKAVKDYWGYRYAGDVLIGDKSAAAIRGAVSDAR